MSIISMVMDIGYFNVNISVKKDEDKRKDILIRRALNNQRIKEISDNRNNILVNYNMYHYMW